MSELLAARWEARHPGFTTGDGPGGVLGGWLRLMWTLARPLARAGVSPDLVTAGGAVAAALSVSSMTFLCCPWTNRALASTGSALAAGVPRLIALRISFSAETASPMPLYSWASCKRILASSGLCTTAFFNWISAALLSPFFW